MDPSFDMIKAVTFTSSAIALIEAGAIFSISYYATPILKSVSSQPKAPTSHALGQLRSLFSSGSHIFPQAASVSALGFAWLAYVVPQQRLGYGLAATAVAGIMPFTMLVMLPAANGRLIELDEKAKRDAREGEDRSREVDDLLARFGKLNGVRGMIMALGGLTGLWVALS